MSIKETLEKIKPFYPLILMVLVSCVFFGLGRLSALKRSNDGISIEYPTTSESSGQTGTVINTTTGTAPKKETSVSTSSTQSTTSGEVIGSKSGKKYYFPWCGTVKRIKPENQVHFASIEEAKAAGFTAGGNCKGLQ